MNKEKIYTTGNFGFIVTCCNCGSYVSPETRDYKESDKIISNGQSVFTCLVCGQTWKY